MSGQFDTTAQPRLQNICDQLAGLGIPTVTRLDGESGRAAVEAAAESGRLDVALERLSVPLVQAGYQRNDLIGSVWFLLLLLWVTTGLLGFACLALLPTYQDFYEEADLTYSTGLLNYLWVRDRVLPALNWLSLLVPTAMIAMLAMKRFEMPWWLPGQRAYARTLARVRQSRVAALQGHTAFWQAIELHHRGEAIAMAARLRAVAPFLLSFVVGGALVAGYAYVLFLPIVQMIYDLSDIETMRQLQ